MQRENDTDPIDIYVGKRLHLARIMRGLSQSYLGGCVGVSFQQIQKYEAGANRISASKLAWFARTLGVPVHYFFQSLPPEYHGGGSPVAPPDDMPSLFKDVIFRRETHKLINLYYGLKDDKQREVILSFLETIANGQSAMVQECRTK